MREHNDAVNQLDFITGRDEITVDYAPGQVETVRQHDGSLLRLRKLDADYDVHDRIAAMEFLQATACGRRDRDRPALSCIRSPDDLHGHLNTVETPLNLLGEADLCPGSAALEKLNASLR